VPSGQFEQSIWHLFILARSPCHFVVIARYSLDLGFPRFAPPPLLATHFQTLETFARNSVAGLKPFLGSYFRYHYSSIYPGRIIRAVTVIYQSEDIVRYVTVENLPVADGSNTECYGFTYRGVCYMMGSRRPDRCRAGSTADCSSPELSGSREGIHSVGPCARSPNRANKD